MDPDGKDIYLENTTSVKRWHQRVSVNVPGDKRLAGISFARKGNQEDGFFEAYVDDPPAKKKAGSGVVYSDHKDATTKIVKQFKTTPEEDALVLEYMRTQISKTGKYNHFTRNCRDYSKYVYDLMVSFITARREEIKRTQETRERLNKARQQSQQ